MDRQHGDGDITKDTKFEMVSCKIEANKRLFPSFVIGGDGKEFKNMEATNMKM